MEPIDDPGATDEGGTEGRTGVAPAVEAPALNVLIAGLAKEVRDLKLEVVKVFHQYRIIRVLVVLVVLGLMVGGYAIADNRAKAHTACRRDNTMREANLNLWRPLLLTPTSALPADATPAQIAERAQNDQIRDTFQKTLESGFALHDC
jgi:hypothetical protein